MSSLRLAMKKSLEEAGPALPERDKKRRIKKLRKDSVLKRGARPGEPPKIKRKRGRPRKHPRPEDMLEKGELRDAGTEVEVSEEGHPVARGLKHDRTYGDENDDDLSSENEFSYDEEEDDDNDDSEGGDDEEGEVRDDGHDENPEDENDDDIQSTEEADGSESHLSSVGPQPILTHTTLTNPRPAHHGGGLSSQTKDGATQEDEFGMERKLLKEKSDKSKAANAIQNQWKKKKGAPKALSTAIVDPSQKSNLDAESGGALVTRDPSNVTDLSADSVSAQNHAISQDPKGEGDDDAETSVGKKKKKNRTGVVPPPTAEVMDRALNLTDKECRKHIDVGLRVKVRFATKVKKEGKPIVKKIWYGGRVAVVSKRGTKIKIKYDDGTSEIAKFPDDDIVVDAVMNGEHAKPADFFLPIAKEGSEVESVEEGEVEEPSNSIPCPPKEDESSSELKMREVVTSPVELVEANASNSEPSEMDKEYKIEVDPTTATVEQKTPSNTISRIASEDIASPDNRSAVDLLTSPEEGELSPGITTHRMPITDVAETQTTHPPEEAPPEEAMSTSIDDGFSEADAHAPQQTSSEATTENTILVPPKVKPVIRIPAQKANTSSKAIDVQPPLEEEMSIDNILVDTPMNDNTAKQKFEETKSAEEEPPRSKIKVVKEDADDISLEESNSKAEEDQNVNGGSEEKIVEHTKPKSIKLRLSSNLIKTAEIELAPPQQITGKKKKKKSERSKSPRPHSLLPKSDASPTKMEEEEVEEPTLADEEKELAVFDSRSAKSPKGDADGGIIQPALKSVTSLDSFEGNFRGGRKAAQQAKEKLTTKDKERDATVQESLKKKKKKRRIEEMEAGGDSTEILSKGPEWVQCDSCAKWRILPDDVKVSSLPNLWYCHMNVYDPKRCSCDAPEQTQKEALKERRKALKKAKRLEAEAVQLEAKKEGLEQMIIPVSPKATKGLKSGGKVKEQPDPRKKGHSATEDDQPRQSDLGSESQIEEKKKAEKLKTKEETEDIINMPIEPKKPGRKRGRPARNPTPSTPQPHVKDTQDEDNVEWVQCEKCEKWRKLPPDISADELPDTWYCSMNTWNPSSASCNADEDKTDAQHHEVGSSEWQLRQTHAGKYSYRQMIFGTGARKQNRPLSERSRAAESLFVKPVEDDDENPIPTTQYSKSSAFLPRTSNFNKTANAMSEESIGIFDVLSNSKLWAQLRAMEQAKPMTVESSFSPNLTFPKFVTYENLPNEIKIGMQDVVLQILGNSALLGDEVIYETQRYPWENKTMIGYCNADVVINTLLALVRDGIIEMATSRNPNIPIEQWIPKYRRVRSKRALAAEEAIKSSKCMKIAKPWKQREETKTEWISGQRAFH
ncbi:CW-type zinc finger domain containing protein [Nitzschia inconspicua]|uniref:CW-type zinc finger domain containing protein n=1 Tax=Nitzschia inconspicua TaxID=303405 RepID=A0A9K3M5F0_9STRA|nr:CW-type zinc finger domain containing protein [Nitzschia inconspicua]